MTQFERCEQEGRQTETLAQEAAPHLEAQREQARRQVISTPKQGNQTAALTKPQTGQHHQETKDLSSPVPTGVTGEEAPTRTKMPQRNFTEVPPPEGSGISREDV